MSTAPVRPPVVDIWANLASGSPDIATPTYIDTGFPLVSGVPVIPPRGYFNWLFQYAMNAARYFSARGIGDWDSTEDQYGHGSVVRDSSDNRWYVLVGAATTGTAPHSDIPDWVPVNWKDRGVAGEYLNPIAAWRTALGKTRDFIDHRGFLSMARITRWQEDWTDKAFTPQTGTIAADTAWAKRWLATQSLGGGSPTAKILPWLGGGPYPSGPGSPVYVDGTLVLDSGNITAGPSGLQLVEAAGGTQFSDNGDVVMQTELVTGVGGTPALGNAETAFGLSAGLSGASGLLASTTPYAAAIVWPPSYAHWQLYTFNPNVGGSPVLTDLGSASLTAVRWRIEIQGANTSDDGQRRVLVYGDGAILANVVYDMTVSSAPPYLAPFFRLYSGGDFFARFGVTDFAAVRWPGDISY
jgi:hypothetical protein